ncbi:MAG: chromosome segregation protein SMC [Pseudomonadota bacterium]
MNFARLRVSGFKSFVETTDFLIVPGLTGIVGPNGCGKSNLVEALRWVMGENRVTQMRGGEMDDVIFNGTSSRPARSIAEVALVVDNSARRAPAAFNDQDEFEVARRIERGQGSIYRIAGREVRARDVQLLFADAASGSHSPALVSQGRIGAMIQARPIERRALLEEAAGITGLHSRRHDADLKLRAAEANLTRLDDVLATLDLQDQGLRKQARQAARYRNMSARIRRAEAIALRLRWRAASGTLDAARERLARAEREVVEIAGRAAAAATEMADRQARLPDLRNAEAEAAAALARLGLGRDGLAAEERRNEAALAHAEARLASLAADRAREREQLADAEAALARLEVERDGLARAEAEAGPAIRDREDELGEARAAVERHEAEFARLTACVAAAEAEGQALARERAELAERAARLAARLDDISAERRRLEAAAADVVADEAAAERVGAAEAKLALAREEADRAAAARRVQYEEGAGAGAARRGADAELARIEAEAAALAAVLESGASADFPPVLDAIAVGAGFEAALGAALGDDLAAPLDPAAAVHWRPMEAHASPAGPALPAGVEGLSKFVTAPPALARRLAQIGVVADHAEGERLAAGLAQGQRLVSRSGGLWRWDGFRIKAGATTAAAARLAHIRRLAELAPLRQAAAAVAEGARARLAAAEVAAGAAERQDQRAGAAAQAAIGELAAVREDLAAVAREQAAARARAAGLAEQAVLLSAELAEQRARSAVADRRLAAIADPEPARERLARNRAALTAERARTAELEGARQDLARDAEARARRLGDIGAEASAWRGRAAGAGRQLVILEERRRDESAERDRLERRPGEIAAERAALFARLAAAEAKRREAGDRLAAAESEASAAGRRLKAIEGELAGAREQRVRAEAEAEHGARELDGLVARIRERLDCAPEETLAVGGAAADDDLPPLAEVEARLERLVKERDTMGPVNLRAEAEAAELESQIAMLRTEKNDLVGAIARLRQGISSLNREGRERLLASFAAVNRHFEALFVRLFGGGRAHLSLVGEGEPAAGSGDPLEAGLEVMASPPGKKLQALSLLSGGEQALAALALLFAVFLTSPAPICVLDEVDAPLDDANVERFCALLDDIARQTGTRFLVVTHHRLTMARMDRLFGVTMAEQGVSQLVSVDLREAVRIRAAG